VNKQLNRQLRKKVASLRFEIETLFDKHMYVSGFVQFLAQNGVDVAGMERRYREHIDEQAKA
jgi:hypothetical protein